MNYAQGIVAKISVVPVREAFKHEALSFTTWLESNIDALAERLGFDLSVKAREKSVGDFKVDLYCEDSQGNLVIVENQLERTDHDHLGKLITYLVNLNARVAIWITTEPRQEHERVIDWLNENTPANIGFFLVKVEAIKIGDSPYAPLFTVLAQPDEQIKEIGDEKQETQRELKERHVKRKAFWNALLQEGATQSPMFQNRTPGIESWFGFGSGMASVTFRGVIRIDGSEVDVYIDVGDRDKNKYLFDRLYEHRQAIEADIGRELDWRRLDNIARASRIVAAMSTAGGLYDELHWPELQDEMIQMLIKFDKYIRPRIAKVR